MSTGLIAVMMVVAVVVGLLACLQLRLRRFRAACRVAFEEVFGTSTSAPDLQMGVQYGFPSFTVTFGTRRELQDAEMSGATDRFARRIAALCKDVGDEKQPFDAHRGIWFTSKDR